MRLTWNDHARWYFLAFLWALLARIVYLQEWIGKSYAVLIVLGNIPVVYTRRILRFACRYLHCSWLDKRG